MHRTCFIAATALLLGDVRAGPAPMTMLTVAQRDRVRSPASPPSVSVSGDGRLVAFASYERLSPADQDELADIYVLEHDTGTVTLESVSADGAALRSDCIYPRLSQDGRYLVFEAALLLSPTAPAHAAVIFRDRVTDSTRRVSIGPGGQPANGWSGGAALSDDGAVVVFESSATNLVPGADANGPRSDIYLVQTRTMQTTRISVDSQGVQSAEGASISPSLSGDGRQVAFISTAPLADRAGPDGRTRAATSSSAHRGIYLRDTQRQVTRRLRPPPAGGVQDDSSRPVISRDGAYVAYVSSVSSLVDGDQNRSPDVFLADVATGSVTLVSRTPAGRPANGVSGSPSISRDGRFVAFQSNASNFVCAQRCEPDDEDINLVPDVFLFDRVTGRITWVSVGAAGGWMEESVAPVLDAAGLVLAFTSRHPIDELDTAHDFDLFVRVTAPER